MSHGSWMIQIEARSVKRPVMIGYRPLIVGLIYGCWLDRASKRHNHAQKESAVTTSLRKIKIVLSSWHYFMHDTVCSSLYER
jgi:hypothetical protein